MKDLPYIIIEPRKGWQLINFSELKEYRDLFYMMVKRDISILYKQTLLGFAWAVLNPLFTMIVFTVIFGKITNIATDGIPYPVFSFAALVPWTYFAQAVTSSSNSLLFSTSLITKVYFPRLIIPLTPVVSKLLDFLIAFGLLVLMILFYGFRPGWNFIFVPMLILLMVITAAGAGMWLSALAIKYRDVKFAITFLLQLLMFAAPVVWPVSAFDAKVVTVYGYGAKLLYGLYPMVGIIEGFRAALFNKPMPWDLIIGGTISSMLILISGALYFRKTERIFADIA